jgi:hypothetical protein
MLALRLLGCGLFGELPPLESREACIPGQVHLFEHAGPVAGVFMANKGRPKWTCVSLGFRVSGCLGFKGLNP